MEGVVPKWPPKMFDLFLISCFVYFLNFIVKLLNINRFAQPQRMRIDNTEGMMQKYYHMLFIIESMTNKCHFLSLLSQFPCLALACKLILSTWGFYLLPSIYRALMPRSSGWRGKGVCKQKLHPSSPFLDILPFQELWSWCARGQEHQVSRGSIKHSCTPWLFQVFLH